MKALAIATFLLVLAIAIVGFLALLGANQPEIVSIIR